MIAAYCNVLLVMKYLTQYARAAGEMLGLRSFQDMELILISLLLTWDHNLWPETMLEPQ